MSALFAQSDVLSFAFWTAVLAAGVRLAVSVGTAAIGERPADISATGRRGATRKGGHFAAFEQPELFVDEVRACFRRLRES